MKLYRAAATVHTCFQSHFRLQALVGHAICLTIFYKDSPGLYKAKGHIVGPALVGQ